MNDDVLEALLIYCLDELEAGVPAAEIVARYPGQEEMIRPLLDIAVQLSQLAPEPPAQAQAASQSLFLAHAKAIKQANRQPLLGRTGWRRLVFSLAVFVLLFVAFLAVSEQTASALPGTTFYPVKRAAEELRLSLTDDQNAREALTNRFEAERVKEINTLLVVGREAQVECHGFIDEMGAESWTLCGLRTVVDAQTVIEGNPTLGAEVWVVGVVADGRFTAARIVVLSGNDVPPTLLPTQTPTPLPTPLPTHTPSAVPTNTHTAVPTTTPPAPTSTAVPNEETPTATTTMTPIPEIEEDETPEPDDDDGTPEPEQDDDDDDDNSGPGSGDDDDDNSGSGGNSGPGGGD